jgi:hypothetical protein
MSIKNITDFRVIFWFFGERGFDACSKEKMNKRKCCKHLFPLSNTRAFFGS